ncbi:uncharacterized protein LOC110731277 [Chenopodium quinoa]|uniref:Uncharacterized protein n=1 Tax=Chenopodium quinoa TaxID=63459 RepID=A0A803L3F9_CHEQI|nr:uncharacterized protein LOC110731277 [Chenopodium quinoa]
MLKFRSSFNGVQSLNFSYGFHLLLRYSTSASISGEANPNFANYFVECLGFSRQHALSTSAKLARYRHIRGFKKVCECNSNFIENANSVIKFLKQIGLEQSHVQDVIISNPRILFSNVDKTLMPKNEVFLKMGFSRSDVIDVVKVNPSIFFAGSIIVPLLQALREIMSCDSHVIDILKKLRGMRLHGISKNFVPNVALLQNYGIPIESIRKFMLRMPFTFSRKPDIFEDVVIRVEKDLGIARDSPKFLLGIHMLASVNKETFNSKIEMFKSFGWTESDVLALFRRQPSCFGLSVATIKKKLAFFMTELGYQPDSLISWSLLLTYNLEKRMVPRHMVILALKEKGLIRMDYPFHSATSLSESRFLERFVLPFKEVHEYSKHVGLSMEVLTQTLLENNPDRA